MRAGESVRWRREAVGSEGSSCCQAQPATLSRVWKGFRDARSLAGSEVMKLWRRVLSTASTEVTVQPSAGPCSATVPAVPSHTEDVTEAFEHTRSHEPRLSVS